MSISKFSSCERNNYFFGKLMTVKDFENEQNYFNSKRHLCTHMLHGSGIVSGLRVVLVNNQTISIESGLAIDYLGREVLVPESCIKKISVIDGFDDCCDSSEVYLCLRYKEDLEETTFSVVGSGKSNDVSQEFNRIHEGYELFLTDKKPDVNKLGVKHLMDNIVPIYDRDGVKLSIIMPKYTNPSRVIKATVVFEKNNVAAPVNYSFDISGEFFKSMNGEDKVTVKFNESEISTYKTIKKDIFFKCDAVTEALTDIYINKEKFFLDVGNKQYGVESDIECSVNISNRPLKDLLIENYYSIDIDSLLTQDEDKLIYLAKFYLVSNHSDYFIEAFENNPFSQYLLNTELLDAIQEIEKQYEVLKNSEDIKLLKNSEEPSIKVEKYDKKLNHNIVTGVEEISLGFYPKVGKSYYSNEFVHGLGYGQVGVIAALENSENMLTAEDHLYIFGNRDVFDDEELSVSSPKANVGVLINPEKGTMKLGIKLLDKTEQTSVNVRWWAFRPSNNQVDAKAEVLLDDSIKVVVTPPTAQVEPLGQVRFTAKIEGASSQEIRWFVVEDGSGTIDNNGLYSAPAKEGVYEIRAQSVKYEKKFASAYVVVSSY